MDKISVIVPEQIGTINRNIYGHFTEHIGGVFYDGIWVGENSRVPNIHGFRKDLVEMLRKLNPPIIRWPGGCFAETYDWRDGIGPREQRPKTANFWHGWDGRTESNEVGTHEFVDFCRLVGAEPYFAANATTSTPLEIRNWIEYCNYPRGSTSLAGLREQNGSPEPFNVIHWGIGNENWGDGGNMTPEDYCFQFRRYANIANRLDKDRLKLIACGPNGNDLNWTRRFFGKLHDLTHPVNFDVYGYSMHYYCGTSGSALEFSEDQWYELLSKAEYMENVITDQRALMDSWDPGRKTGIVVDEWGCWHPEGSGPSKGKNLFEQQSTMRDALVAAVTLNIFNNHCDKVIMANVAQMVNNLHSLFLTSGEKFVATPNYHVFDMFKGHQSGAAVRTIVDAETIEYHTDNQGDKNIHSVSCSASIKDGRLTLTLASSHHSDGCEVKINIHGGRITGKVSMTTLAAADPHNYNSFEEPNRVSPYVEEMPLPGGELVIALKPASVVTISSQLTVD